ALLAGAIPSRAGRLNDDAFAGGDLDAQWFGREWLDACACLFEEATGTALAATEDTPRLVGEPLALPIEDHGVTDRAHDTAQAEATTMLARAAGVLDETV